MAQFEGSLLETKTPPPKKNLTSFTQKIIISARYAVPSFKGGIVMYIESGCFLIELLFYIFIFIYFVICYHRYFSFWTKYLPIRDHFGKLCFVTQIWQPWAYRVCQEHKVINLSTSNKEIQHNKQNLFQIVDQVKNVFMTPFLYKATYSVHCCLFLY